MRTITRRGTAGGSAGDATMAAMGTGAKSAFVSAVAVVTAVLIVGRVVGWRDAWEWITGWWTPGWGNLFTVAIAAAGVWAAIRNNKKTLDRAITNFRQARIDARVDKLRAEIAALVTAVDEQKSAEKIMQPGVLDAMAQAGMPTPY